MTPNDIVPRRSMNADELRELDAFIGREVEVTMPGEVIADRDGIPAWMTQPTTSSAFLSGATLTAAEVRAAGLTAADIPNITIIDTEE